MIRLRGVEVAAALAIGAGLGLGASTAGAQVMERGPSIPPRVYAGVTNPYGFAELYGPAYYANTPNNYRAPGRVPYGPVRDWSTGRPMRLAKPWMLPLPR